MALAKCHYREKLSTEWFHFVILFHILQQNILHTSAVESHSQAFIQTDNHLTYIGDGRDIDGIPLEVNPGHFRTEDVLYKSSVVKLEPTWLDFKERPVGMPHMEHVFVQNIDSRNDLHLLSISGSTVHFHCSFFQEKIVPPGGNTTFDVVFLARQEGNVENTLYIHTSAGSYTYHVFGVGIPNPYRLRPYLGAKVPLNSTFSPLIQMHNPHSSTLQVLEMFSSQGDLHLELPTGELEAPRSLWEIPPYETKAVMKANFIGRVENNHTAFIRIKTNSEKKNQLLILPVEVEVTSAPGLYSSLEMIDFGIVRTLDGPVTSRLNLLNTGLKAVQISSVTVSPPNDAVSIDFRPTKLQPDVIRQTPVAHITFDAEKAVHSRQWSGKIIVKSKDSTEKITIPYKAVVLHGSLVYNTNNTYFFSAKDLWNTTRSVTFTNTFNFPIVLYNITLPSHISHYFSIENFSSPVILQPQQTFTPFSLTFHPNVTQLHFTTFFTLHTNASVFKIPIVVYSGLLKVIPHRPEKFKGQFDFGTLGIRESRCMIFTLRNDNPVDIHIGEITPELNGTKVMFLGMERGNGTTLTQPHNATEVDFKLFVIKPYHFAVFSLNLTAPDHEGIFAADMLITTQFQDIWIPLAVRTADGSLRAIPENIVFDRMYPGMVDYRVLQIHSTFRDFMEVIDVSFQPSDSRFYYRPPNSEKILLVPDKANNVGKIYFDAKKECKEDCYVGLPTSTPAGHQWLLGLTLDKEAADTDQYLYTRLQQKWDRIHKASLNTVNVTIEVDTNEVQGFLFSAQAHLHWPSLVRKCQITFPLTQIGNISISDFIVENPGDVPILIQILPLPLYPNAQTILDLHHNKLSPDLLEMMETDDLDIFTLPDLEQYNPSPQNPVPGFRKNIELALGVKPHKHSITTILHPGVKVKVRVGFQPSDDIPRTSIILIRNNLTIIDSIVVQGQGGLGELKLSNKRPGSAIPLQFDMTERHLKNCDKKKHSKSMIPNFTVRRSFTLKNTGELPFYVHGYSINGSPCEGYGFRVLDCEGFDLYPNTSHKVDIAFTPDFTMSRIRRTLTIHTSLGVVANYTLQATVPPHTLSRCSSALPRPNWEPVLYYSITCVMGFLLFCILVAAYFEADRIFVADIIRRNVKVSNSTQTFDKSKVFDLKHVAGITSSPSVPLKTLHITPTLEQHQSVIGQKTSSELTNGHISHACKKESFTSMVLNIFRNFFSKPLQPRIKSKPDNKEPTKESTLQQQQQPQSVSYKMKYSEEKNKPPVSQDSIGSEKSVVTQKNKVNKKAARRQHSADLPVHQVESQSHYTQPEVKYAALGTDSHEQFLRDTKVENLIDKERNQQQQANTYQLVNGGDNLVPIDEPIEIQPTNEFNKKGKKKNKSKADIIPPSRYVIRQSIDDDTSSTTTESSIGEGEEKSSSARDSTPEPLQSKPKKLKSKTPNPKSGKQYENSMDNDDFELTSKSKAHRKIKSNQKDVYGGNIFHPDSLELPYNFVAKEEKKNKPKKVTKNKGVLALSSESSDGSDHGQDEVTPAWDMPSTPLSPGDDLTELSQQTAVFAQKHTKPLPSNGFTSGETLSGNSRSSSYSSIVSNGSDKSFPSGFNSVPIETPAAPGAIGTRSRPAPVTIGAPRNVWNNSPPASPDAMLGGFGLQTIEETNRPILPETPTTQFLQQDQPLANENFCTSFGGFERPQTLSLMQRLQQDRRNRLQEHRRRIMKGEEWPGFDVPPPGSESLWDNDYIHMGNEWSTNTENTVTTSGSSLWSTLTNSANSSWNSLMSFTSGWGSAPTSTVPSTMTRDSPLNSFEGNGPVNNAIPPTESVRTFNPFNSMADIWGPNAPGTSTGWSFPDKPKDKQC